MEQTLSHTRIADELISKLRTLTARIGVFGLGYVGLPLAIAYLRRGYRVHGIDIDPQKVAALKRGNSYLPHIDISPLVESLRNQTFEASGDFFRAADMDALIICVPTPLGDHREPDLSYVRATVSQILPYLRRGQAISLESSTYPGTTEETLLQPVGESGFRVGEDLFLIYSPEREDPGNVEFTTETIPKIVGGVTPTCCQVGIALYEAIVERVVPVSSTRTAEMAKLLENIYRAVNIGLVNELKTVADRMGIDIFEVIEAAATKPFGFTPFYPGPGLGGHCIPIDPFYLTWKAREFGVNTRFIELAGEVNNAMPSWVVSKTIDALNRQGIPTKGAHILVLGVSYKRNVGDLRESPGMEIMQLMKERGAEVDYSDPYIREVTQTRKLNITSSSVQLSSSMLARYDVVILVTDHDVFDYDLIQASSPLLVDTRGRYRGRYANVVHA